MPELDAIALYKRMAQRARRAGADDLALEHLANALRLAREVGRPALEARARRIMGRVHMQAGRADRAEDCFRAAQDLLGRVGAGEKANSAA